MIAAIALRQTLLVRAYDRVAILFARRCQAEVLRRKAIAAALDDLHAELAGAIRGGRAADLSRAGYDKIRS